MAEEEKDGLEIDDWLDDLQEDESDDAAGAADEDLGELDQSDIDALLGDAFGEGPAAEDAGAEAAPAAEPPEEDAGELDQSDIDALLGGGGDEPAAEAAAEADAGGDIDQSDIDDLLAGGEEDAGELDQSDIDSLLGGGDEAEAPVEAGGGDIDQSDIDGLFASDDEGEEAVAEGGDGEPSQDDVDQLFSDVGEGGADEDIGAETVSFSDVLADDAGGGEEETFGLPDDTGFDEDEFDFGDLPDIPDEETVGTAPEGETVDIFGEDTTSTELTDILSEDDATQKIAAAGGDKGIPFNLPADMNKKAMGITALCLVMLLAGGGYFFFKKDKEEPAVPVALQEQQLSSQTVGTPPPEVPVPAAVNTPPVVMDSKLQMAETGGELNFVLTGTDEDEDALGFEILTPPKHGRLSGDMPNLTYLPNKDFPGEDTIEFRAFDGQDPSNAALVSIFGPDLGKKVAEKPKVIKPKRIVVAARNISLSGISTNPLVINWKNIWKKANKTPYSGKVSVEIMDKRLRGDLKRVNKSRHQYVPDKYYGGSELIKYRFSYAGLKSKVRELRLQFKLGDPAPEIQMQPIAKAYPVGQSVVLDAGLTKDDSPESLVYSWEQVAGVPVQMEALNDDASAITFVVPSTFASQQKIGTVIRLTAVDQSGQRTVKDIRIPTVSRRQTALWRGQNGSLEYEPYCPKGECPGALLPWPYQD